MRVVTVPSTKSIVQPSPGFKKKDLSDFKVELLALCGFGCRYCSSNQGYYMRMNWDEGANFRKHAEDQLGRSVSKDELPNLSFEWPDVLDKLEKELLHKSYAYGDGKVLVFSQLTDGFSPQLVKSGVTKKALDLLVERSSFRIRVLTKSAVVGEPEWIEYFLKYHDRFTVGLSTGSLDDEWAKKMEVGTSPPSQRLVALKNLQDAGVSTYGMLCPVFPDTLMDDRIVELVEQINPDAVEFVWAEPYNDRDNWELVQSSYSKESEYYAWFDDVYRNGKKVEWSKYSRDLYDQLASHANANGWLHKLKYLLYEANLTDEDANELVDAPGILFQSVDDKTGISKHPVIAASQLEIDKADADEIEQLKKNVAKAIKATQKAWLNTGQQLLALHDKMDTLATGIKRKVLWQRYFKVNSFDEYCTEVLHLSREAVYQMTFAVKWIDATRPELLTGSTRQIPHYTNFRVLKPHYNAIESDPDKYSDLVEVSYSGSRNELIKKRNEYFPPKTEDASYVDVFDMQGAIEEFKNTIGGHIGENKRELFIEKMKELENLLLE